MRRTPASPWLATVPPAPTFSEARLASHRSEENPLRRTHPQYSNTTPHLLDSSLSFCSSAPRCSLVSPALVQLSQREAFRKQICRQY